MSSNKPNFSSIPADERTPLIDMLLGFIGYQLKAGQVTSQQTRTLRQAQGTSPSVDSGHRPFGRLRTPLPELVGGCG